MSALNLESTLALQREAIIKSKSTGNKGKKNKKNKKPLKGMP